MSTDYLNPHGVQPGDPWTLQTKSGPRRYVVEGIYQGHDVAVHLTCIDPPHPPVDGYRGGDLARGAHRPHDADQRPRRLDARPRHRRGGRMTITPRRATIAALTTIALMGITTSVARADPTLTATATVRADGSVSLLAGWTCAAPFRQCSYIWSREDGSRVGTGRSFVAAAGVFAAGCHTVTLALSYWYGRETVARKQTASAGFCVPGVAT